MLSHTSQRPFGRDSGSGALGFYLTAGLDGNGESRVKRETKKRGRVAVNFHSKDRLPWAFDPLPMKPQRRKPHAATGPPSSLFGPAVNLTARGPNPSSSVASPQRSTTLSPSSLSSPSVRLHSSPSKAKAQRQNDVGIPAPPTSPPPLSGIPPPPSDHPLDLPVVGARSAKTRVLGSVAKNLEEEDKEPRSPNSLSSTTLSPPRGAEKISRKEGVPSPGGALWQPGGGSGSKPPSATTATTSASATKKKIRVGGRRGSLFPERMLGTPEDNTPPSAGVVIPSTDPSPLPVNTLATPGSSSLGSPILLKGSVLKHNQLAPLAQREVDPGILDDDDDDDDDDLNSVEGLSSEEELSPDKPPEETKAPVSSSSNIITLKVPDGPLGITVLPVSGEAGKRPEGVCGGLVVVKVKGLTRGGTPSPNRKKDKARSEKTPIFNVGDVIFGVNSVNIVGLGFDEALDKVSSEERSEQRKERSDDALRTLTS